METMVDKDSKVIKNEEFDDSFGEEKSEIFKSQLITNVKIPIKPQKETKTEKLNEKQVESIIKLDSSKKEELLTELVSKNVTEIEQLNNLKKEIKIKSGYKKSKVVINNEAEIQQNLAKNLENIQLELLNAKKDNEDLKLQLKKSRVINPNIFASEIQSHPFLKDRPKELFKKSTFFNFDTESNEITFRMKSRMVDFIKKLETQMIKEKIPLVKFNPEKTLEKKLKNAKSETKIFEEKSQILKINKTTLNDTIDLKQSVIDDLTMQSMEFEDEIEMKVKLENGFRLKKSELNVRIIDLQRNNEKTRLMNNNFNLCQEELQILLQNEIGYKQKIEEAIRNPLLGKKNEYEIHQANVLKREKILIKIKSETEKMEYFQKEKNEEKKIYAQKIEKTKKEIKQKEINYQELLLIQQIKTKKYDFESILTKPVSPNSIPKLNEIYKNLIETLQKTSECKFQKENQKMEGKHGFDTIERHESEKINLRSILMSLGNRMVELGIQMEDVKTLHQKKIKENL